MSAATYRITIEQGATWALTVIAKTTEGTPLDLTGYTARMQWRASPGARQVFAELSTANGRIQIVPTQGRLLLTLPATVSAELTVPSGFYDLFITSPAGVVTRLLQGPAVLTPRVTL